MALFAQLQENLSQGVISAQVRQLMLSSPVHVIICGLFRGSAITGFMDIGRSTKHSWLFGSLSLCKRGE
jgi:hypothetical protein